MRGEGEERVVGCEVEATNVGLVVRVRAPCSGVQVTGARARGER